MRYSSGVRFSRAKPTGSFRVLQPSTRRVASHDETLQDARKSAAYWTSAVSSAMEIQERFPSGEWVTVQVVKPKSSTAKSGASRNRSHATKKDPRPTEQPHDDDAEGEMRGFAAARRWHDQHQRELHSKDPRVRARAQQREHKIQLLDRKIDEAFRRRPR